MFSEFLVLSVGIMNSNSISLQADAVCLRMLPNCLFGSNDSVSIAALAGLKSDPSIFHFKLFRVNLHVLCSSAAFIWIMALGIFSNYHFPCVCVVSFFPRTMVLKMPHTDNRNFSNLEAGDLVGKI